MTIKRKRTTIAPTYTIKNKIAKYSTLSKKSNNEPTINATIKTKMEWIGFWRLITKVHPPKIVAVKKDKKKVSKVID